MLTATQTTPWVLRPFGQNLAGLFNEAIGAFALGNTYVGASNALGDSAASEERNGSFKRSIGDLGGPDSVAAAITFTSA